MRKSIISFLILAAIFLSSCVPTTVLMSSYKGKRMSGDKLAIVTLFSSPLIGNPDDVLDDLGDGVPEDLYMDFFNKNFDVDIKEYSHFEQVLFDSTNISDQLTERELEINDKEKIRIAIPKDGDTIQMGSEPDYILFMGDLNTARVVTQSAPMMGANGAMTGGGSSQSLQHQTRFVIWNNAEGHLVYYGRIKSDVGFLFAMTDNTWKSGIDALAREIFKKSPFYKSPF